jgi:hypothetical protein
VAAFPNGMLYCLYCTTLKHVHYHLATNVNVSATSFKIPCLWVAIASLQRPRWHSRITITCWRTFCGCLGKVRSRTGHEGTDRSRFIALLIHNLCSRNGLMVLYPRERHPVPIVQEAGWASGPVWTGAENLAPLPGFDPRTVHAVASRYTDFATQPTSSGYTTGILTKYTHTAKLHKEKHLMVQWLLVHYVSVNIALTCYCNTFRLTCSHHQGVHTRVKYSYKHTTVER